MACRSLRFFAGQARPGLTILECTVNGQPGVVAQLGGATVAVYAFDVAGDRIKHKWAIISPTSSAGRQADACTASPDPRQAV
jgi:RNA polymerase sigma-70 factor (ECF subfamily)